MMNGKESPSWLEVQHSGVRTLVGRFVYVNGSARPISKINFKDGKYSFWYDVKLMLRTIPAMFQKDSV